MKLNMNEIRIGNLVEINGKVEKVTGVLQYGLYFSGGYCPNILCANGEPFIKPITITEEWLVKFWFKLTISNKDSGYKQYGLNKKGFDIMFSIECNCNPECFLENIGIEINYVHQLQNLYFALTGEELTIKEIKPE